MSAQTASAAATSYDERVLLVAPTRRDGEVTRKALSQAGVDCTVCNSMADLCDETATGVGAIMLTELALTDPAFVALPAVLQAQPSWSSVPIVLLCRDRDQSVAAARIGERLDNVTLLDRPASLRSLISAVQASLRGRRWQYQIRDRIAAQSRAEDALRQADQRKDEFLATLAHELRNPLAPIRTGLHVLRIAPDPTPSARRMFEMMERQLAQLVKLIDELLDVSRITTGKVVLRPEVIDMRSVIAWAVEASQPAFDKARHTLELVMPDDPLPVFGDPARLSQAIGNLLNNAAKYTPDGGRVCVTLARGGSDVVITVADSGVGIPESMLGRVFDLFAQVDRTLDRAQGGLGIGLSLVRSLVGLHGGRVSATSAGADRGSTFEIRIPSLADPAHPRADSAASMGFEPSDSAADPPGLAVGDRPRRILVVDDNVDAADTLGMLLQMSGYETRIHYNASDAWSASSDFMPDVILCDLGMPGTTGHEFATRVRSDSRFASTLLVAVTGWGGEQDHRRSRDAGFDFHFTKPVDTKLIRRIIERS